MRILYLRLSKGLVRMNKGYEYCKQNLRKKTTPRYVKSQMRQWMRIAEGKDKKYVVSEHKVKQVEMILKLLIMPKGLKAGETLYQCTSGYQWLFYIAVICTVHRDNPDKRKYETGLLEICRKNYKTFTIATLFIILFLTEPQFSKFFSVAPDGALSREIREAIVEILKSSPAVYESPKGKRFKILRDYIMYNPTQIKYIPLNYSTSRLDGRLPSVFCADEVGALPSPYAIEAMRSGQLNILNKLGFIISTKYPTIDNPFEAEVSYAKKVLDKTVKDETLFSLLYEPDDEIRKDWMSNDLVLKQANPVALETKEIWEDLIKKRARAIAEESARENFITKHCNIIYQGIGTETYIDVNKVRECRVNHIDWAGKVVYLGLDLSETNDNTSVTMVGLDDDNNILAEPVAFIPEDRVDEKSRNERVNYRALINGKNEKVFACGGQVIDYSFVERYILGIEEKYNVTVQALGYDRWNALSTAQKIANAGYNTVEVKQHSSILHPPTKFLREKILEGKFRYETNPLYEINFQNARCTYDTNKNLFVNKKRSSGKVDMVVSTIIAIYLLQQDVVFDDGFTVQVI